MLKAKLILQEALKSRPLLSKTLGLKVRPLVTTVRHNGKLLFSDRYLLYTNTGISVGLSIFGDLLQQNHNINFKENHSKKWDKKRTGQMAASGFALGPLVHYWYLFLDKWFPGRTAGNLVKKILLDQVVLSPIYIVIFLVTVGVLQNQSWNLMKEELKDTGISLYLADLVVWTPAQTINFYFLPTRFRVLFDNIVSLGMDVWYSYIRFDCSTHQPHSETEEVEDFKIDTNKEDSGLNAEV